MNLKRYLQFWCAQFRGEPLISASKKSIFDIDYQVLRKDHALIIFDYDDTLSSLYGDLSPEVVELLSKIQQLGYEIGVVSNCNWGRYLYLRGKLNAHNIYISPNRDKPSPKGFHDISIHYHIPLEQTVSIGDRLGTECFGSKLAGVKTIILVDKYTQVFKEGKSIPILNWLDALERSFYFKKHS